MDIASLDIVVRIPNHSLWAKFRLGVLSTKMNLTLNLLPQLFVSWFLDQERTRFSQNKYETFGAAHIRQKESWCPIVQTVLDIFSPLIINGKAIEKVVFRAALTQRFRLRLLKIFSPRKGLSRKLVRAGRGQNNRDLLRSDRSLNFATSSNFLEAPCLLA